MNKLTAHPVIIFTASFLIVIAVYFLMTRTSTSSIINDAASLYEQGEVATTVFEREQKFNNALQLYLDLEKTFDPRYSNGKIYYNIANTFYQLNQYPFAILYYAKALTLNNDARIHENLQTVREKANVSPPQYSASLIETISLKNWLSLPTRLQLFGLSALISFALFSLIIWRYLPLVGMIGGLFACIAFFFLATSVLGLLFSPKEAVVVNSEYLRKGASPEFASVIEEPIRAGSIVRVVGQEKNWLKVLYHENKVGFIPEKSLRKV